MLVALSATPTFAQNVPVPIETREDIQEFCTTSEPQPTDQREVAGNYRVERQRHARTLFSTMIDHVTLPVMDYDSLRGTLDIPVFKTVHVVDGVALELETPQMIRFEMIEREALEAAALYKLGRARLQLRFIPGTYARWDDETCAGEDASKVLKVALLEATLVDSGRRELATYRSDLGREVEMLRAHKVDGYLGSAYPVVRITSLMHVESSSDAMQVRAGDLTAVARKTKTRTTQLGEQAAPLRAELEHAFFACYVRGLSQNARLQGALVARLDLKTPTHTAILVDSIHESAVSTCATARMRELARHPPAGLDKIERIRVTVMFRLEEAGGL